MSDDDPRLWDDVHAIDCDLDVDCTCAPRMIDGDALDLIGTFADPIDLLVTDPPYAFGGAGGEHALSATVAVVLREAARRLAPGSWAIVFAASSWRSTAYMVEAVRGVSSPCVSARGRNPRRAQKSLPRVGAGRP